MTDEFSMEGVRVEDIGDYIRVYGPYNVVKATEIPFLSKDGVDTGIKYAVGTDTATGETKVAWVDYPKSVFTYDDIVSNPRILQIFRRCNVCLAVDRIRNETQSAQASRSDTYWSQPPGASSAGSVHVPPPYTSSSQRLSLGDVAVPKYLPLMLQLAKSLLFTKFGEVTTSLMLSVLTDVLSGATGDPNKRDILRSMSDAIASETLYSMTPEDVEQLKKDLTTLSTAYQTDRNLLTAVVKAAIRSPVIGNDANNKQQSRQYKTSGQVRTFRGVLD